MPNQGCRARGAAATRWSTRDDHAVDGRGSPRPWPDSLDGGGKGLRLCTSATAIRAHVAMGLAQPLDPRLVMQADIAHLPEPVKRYLRVPRAVGHPRVCNYRLRLHGRMRSAPNARWMPFVADQQSFVNPATRLFSCVPRCTVCRSMSSIDWSMDRRPCA